MNRRDFFKGSLAVALGASVVKANESTDTFDPIRIIGITRKLFLKPILELVHTTNSEQLCQFAPGSLFCKIFKFDRLTCGLDFYWKYVIVLVDSRTVPMAQFFYGKSNFTELLKRI